MLALVLTLMLGSPLYGSLGPLGMKYGGAAASELLTGLVAYYQLEEASNVARLDATGRGNDLADVNASVPQVAGRVGFGVAFNGAAGTRRLARAHTADLAFGPGVSGTVTCWVRMNSLATAQDIVSKFSGVGATQEWSILYNNATGRFLMRVRHIGGASSTQLDLVAFGAPSTAVWYFLAMTYDSPTKTLRGSVNAGAWDSAVTLDDVQSSPQQTFAIGSRGDSQTATRLDGDVDEVGKWSRVLSDAEIAQLYGGGAGLSYPF